jgi:hypothetical protein
MAADGARTSILTVSPENHAATAALGYAVIGRKERMIHATRVSSSDGALS